MLQFDVELCRVRSNAAQKVRRYISFFVASGLAHDVDEFILKRICVENMNNRLIRLWRIPAFLSLSLLGDIQRGLFINHSNL